MVGPRLSFQVLLGWVLLVGQPTGGEEPHQIDPLSSEELEEIARMQHRIMEENKDYFISHFSDMAQDFINKNSDHHLYRQLEDDQSLTFKKAVGTMVYVRLFLAKTNCTNEDMKTDISIQELVEELREETLPKPRPCVLPRISEQETLDCTFGVFLDARSSKLETVVDEECRPVLVSSYW